MRVPPTRRAAVPTTTSDPWQGLTALRFEVPGAPVPKARPRLGRNGTTYTPFRTVEAEDRIANRLKEMG